MLWKWSRRSYVPAANERQKQSPGTITSICFAKLTAVLDFFTSCVNNPNKSFFSFVLVWYGLGRVLSLTGSWNLVSVCLVPRRLFLDENVRAKEGGKETTGETTAFRLPSVPFPSSLAAHYQSLASTLRKAQLLRRRLGPCRSYLRILRLNVADGSYITKHCPQISAASNRNNRCLLFKRAVQQRQYALCQEPDPALFLHWPSKTSKSSTERLIVGSFRSACIHGECVWRQKSKLLAMITLVILSSLLSSHPSHSGNSLTLFSWHPDPRGCKMGKNGRIVDSCLFQVDIKRLEEIWHFSRETSRFIYKSTRERVDSRNQWR